METPGIVTQLPRAPLDQYTVSTPFGTLTIANGGRSVSYELYDDIRQSVHNTALFNYIQHLLKQGVTRFNVDHLNIPGKTRALSLVRGKAHIDLIYESNGKLIECELKTRREIGLEVTAQQLIEMTKRCDHLQLLVPRGCLEDAANVLHLLNLTSKITIVPYDYFEDETDG